MGESLHQQMVEYYSAYKEIDYLYGKLAAKSGLSDSAFWVLYSIREFEGKCTQRSICTQWSYRKQTVNSSLKSLEKRGFIKLVAANESKKSKHIVLTEAGEAFANKTVDLVFSMEKNIFEKMNCSERQALLLSTHKYLELFRKEVQELSQNSEHSE